MKNSLKNFLAAAVLSVSMTAQAGAGLSVGALANLANGDVLISAIGGGLGAASLMAGIKRIQNGRVGWGVFFVVLAEKDLITASDSDALMNADVATQEAFIGIITDKDLSSEEKEELLAELNL